MMQAEWSDATDVTWDDITAVDIVLPEDLQEAPAIVTRQLTAADKLYYVLFEGYSPESLIEYENFTVSSRR